MQTERTRFLPKVLAVELHRLPWRLLGSGLLGVAALCWAALVSWSFADPSPNYATFTEPRNWLGLRGAAVADFLIGAFGLAAPLLVIPVAALGLQIASGYTPLRPRQRAALWSSAAIMLPAFFSCFATPKTWLPNTGLGGIVGDAITAQMVKLLPALPGSLVWPVLAAIFAAPGAWLFWKSCGLSLNDFALAFGIDTSDPAPSFSLDDKLYETAARADAQKRATSWVKFFSPRERALVPKAPREFWMTEAKTEPRLSPRKAAPARKADGFMSDRRRENETASFANWGGQARSTETKFSPQHATAHAGHQEDEDDEHVFRGDARIEPFFGPASRFSSGWPSGEGGTGPVPAGFKRLTGDALRAAGHGAQSLLNRLAQNTSRSPLIYAKETPTAQDEPAAIRSRTPDGFSLPPLSLLAPAPRPRRAREAFDPDTMQRASALMGVLGDFGVKGKISGIYPGPVVTLFELEPARGTKSSRVIGLSDDIARSMSAVSARVAVIPGRDALGIELPNPERETVSLRDVLESDAFQDSQSALPLALGKSIGGEPIVADLARMPHLLIAGTTGSGKSVGINAMILSLLFKLPPSQCNFILIDPKMLELASYDGIPHLIAPVVTDPKSAVAVLKWAVREMNTRYERMSKLGARNIGGFNAKTAALQLRGGYPAYDGEAFDLAPMPYLVIVIDEMADLMMTAGKDVEFAVQRLSQMARAAGIHLIMATQRPSVDVVTGTIKANFPSRISFQVTSKIDSRTIIGEQGAEQLLGAGDMLYMAAGGRIIRAHGPFVSDGEVEALTQYLKTKGSPCYREDIFEDGPAAASGASSERMSGGSDDLYGQAIEIVLKDRRPTTSYLQRRLGIGYNRAASLIERMEQDGIIGAANRNGRRDILAGEEPSFHDEA